MKPANMQKCSPRRAARQRFGCYPEGSINFAQLGVLTNLEAALTH
jgi:hypothetical protein